MELQTTKRRIGLTETIFDDFDERPVDCDFMLPDFLPDIAAVLKCTMRPVVQSHQVSGGRVTADGTVYLQVLYLDEERKCVRSFDCTQPFTSTFTVKDMAGSDAITLNAATNYVNCRATSPRRVDIHGAFSVKLIVTSQNNIELVETVTGDHVHCKTGTIACTVPSGDAEKTFTLNEVLELTGSAAELMMRNDVSAYVSECKLMPEKAVVKGDLFLKTTYITDSISGALCHAKHRIPFSQIVDVDGLHEEMLCECRARVLSCDIRLTPNPNGENRLLAVTVKITLSLRCFSGETMPMLTDAFHTAYPLKLTTRRINPCCLTDVSCDMTAVQQTVPLPENDIAEVLDVWGEVTGVNSENGTVGMLVQLLTRDSAGIISYYERSVDLAVPTLSENATVTVLETEYSAGGDSLELKVQLIICRHTMVTESCLAITELEVDESAPYRCAEGMENCQIKVCFANAGESLWEIAKAEHASPTALQEENGLHDDILSSRTMLLIPLG